jgi:cytochrome d ubiquinol oxidase subunit II
MFRGIALEVRAHFNSELWHQFWDAAFSLSSALLIAVFGIVLGNLLRGLPLDNNGYFRGTFAVLLNPYALLVGLFALAALAMHGAAFLALRVEGELGARATTSVLNIWWGVGALYLAVTVLTLRVHEWTNPSWLQVIPAFSIAALWLLRWSARNRSAILAFVASSCFIVTLMVASAGTLFPYLLPAFGAEERGISIFTAAPSSVALNCALSITIVGIVLVSIYGPFVWRRIAGKIRVE